MVISWLVVACAGYPDEQNMRRDEHLFWDPITLNHHPNTDFLLSLHIFDNSKGSNFSIVVLPKFDRHTVCMSTQVSKGVLIMHYAERYALA